jgi:hypothetical protein
VRRRGWLAGFATYLLLLLPVLPLTSHTYRYYLMLPLAGAPLCVAALIDALTTLPVSRRWPRLERALGVTASDLWAGACCAALILDAGRVVRHMETRPSPVFAGLYGDSTVDRAHIARRLIAGVRAASLPPHTRLDLVFRERVALRARIARGSGERPPPNEAVYLERNVRTALLDGLGVRAMDSRVSEARFVLEPDATRRPDRYALYGPGGDVDVVTPAALDSLLASPWIERW